ncbi:putative F-box domain-containing protein [Helianthus anomalus]
MQMKMKMKNDELPLSLIESNILPRLPATSVVGRCMCVCKQWKSFLSTPMFATI